MNLIHRKINFDQDRDYILECHCQINYECDCPWARKIPYQQYREEWFRMRSQIEGFYSYLQETASETGTIAEIIENEAGQRVGYLWALFHVDEDSGFRFAEIQDIFIEADFRQQGVAEALFCYAEEQARQNGARVIRSGTGCENTPSIRLHEKMGFYQYRYEFEKEL